MKQARENLEIRVVRAGKSWRVDCHEIGADLRARLAATVTARLPLWPLSTWPARCETWIIMGSFASWQKYRK
jgi:hypothetical protein